MITFLVVFYFLVTSYYSYQSIKEGDKKLILGFTVINSVSWLVLGLNL